MSALLEIADLHVGFATRSGFVRAVDGVDLAVYPGRTLGIVGESGCGKSATALATLGLLPPTARVSGSIRLDGRELTAVARRELEDIRGRDIGMIFQDPMTSLNPTMRLGTQVAEVLRRHRGLDRMAARARVRELFDEVQIPNAEQRLRAYPHELSGGQRQRVMIAMALACDPRLLVADEPTTALDVTIQAEVLGLIERLRVAHDMGVVIITHDMGVVAQVADEVAVMYAGQIVEHAEAEQLFDHPEHPYTEALLGALPQAARSDVREAPLTAIPGQPPDLIAPPAGCRFALRCPYGDRADGCATEPPELAEIRAGHWVRSAHPASARTGGEARMAR